MPALQPVPVEGSALVEKCDVCIVGAGLAGLNALFVASRYLSRDQKVILVDRRRSVGGMWVDTYPYVRLHQPHGMFTAGNIKWTLGEKSSYLATKGEVLDHFAYCLEVIKQRVRVEELFGGNSNPTESAMGRCKLSADHWTASRWSSRQNASSKLMASGLCPTTHSNSPVPVSNRCLPTPATCAAAKYRPATPGVDRWWR